MSRQARKLSQTGMYHIIFRGISRQNIFEEEKDFEKLKEILIQEKRKMDFEIYAYCFMTNHVHLFIKEKNPGEISKIMAKILSRYAMWFNIKYDRSGVLFCNRYKSEPIEDEQYYISLIRYIHQNPVKAGVVNEIGDYPYSSYNSYLGNGDFVDTYFLLETLHEDKTKAKDLFIELNEIDESEIYEISESQKRSPEHIKRIVMSEINGNAPETLKELDKNTRNEKIRKLVFEKGISKSALERATGISRGTITRVCNEKNQSNPAAESFQTWML